MQTLESLIAERNRAPRVAQRTWCAKNKRGPGRSKKDSRHGEAGAMTLRARLSRRIRRRRARAKNRPEERQLGLTFTLRARRDGPLASRPMR